MLTQHVYHSLALHSFLPFRPSPGVHLPSAWSSSFTMSPWGTTGYKLSVFLFFKVFISPSFSKDTYARYNMRGRQVSPHWKYHSTVLYFPFIAAEKRAATLACHSVEGHFPSLANFKIFSLCLGFSSTMICPLFIYSTLDLLEFLNLSLISSGKFSSDTTSALPHSLSYLSRTPVLYMLNLYELSSIFLNLSN